MRIHSPGQADMWNKSGDGWGGNSGVRTAEQVISDHAAGTFFNVFVAMKDGEAIGYCSFRRFWNDRDTAYVAVLNVRPDWHGKKVGKELVLSCVNETIRLGMPRVDIHTWPGNTKAVPLYKKCGFLWEDRTDSTHLSNYIPTVLKTELFADFFAKADWYYDSTRKIEIKPDGVKENKFEFYGYEWEKDGEILKAGFEKTGRRLRMAETNDYKIEFTAENHELAFGLEYKCSFRVVNKSGKPLNVEITGRDDGAVSFGGRYKADVADEAVFEGRFTVSEITEKQDPWRMHPCVLAEVVINGKRAEFGLGIEPKYPLTLSLAERRMMARPGLTEEVYINIRNALPENASARVTLPETAVTRFEKESYETALEKGKDTSVATRAFIKECGYECLSALCEVTLESGREISFTYPLYQINQGVDKAFAYETEGSYGLVNGMWRLAAGKLGGYVNISKVGGNASAGFNPSALGKPYDNEFEQMKPVVRTFFKGEYAVMEVEFASERLGGVTLTEIFEISAAGILKRRQRVTNGSGEVRDLFLKNGNWPNIGRRAVVKSDGEFHEVADDLSIGFTNIYPGNLDENWVFDASSDNLAGAYWPPSYNRGNGLQFEYTTGALAPGGSFESEDFVLMNGVFRNVRDFRNYVMGIYEDTAPYALNHLEFVVNGGNPVVASGSAALTVKNHRTRILAGSVTVSSPDGLFESGTQENPSDSRVGENRFYAALTPGKSGIAFADFSLKFANFDKKARRVLLIPGGAGVLLEDKGGALTVTNGKLSFAVSPGWTDAVHSLKYQGREWIYTGYPEYKPYSWWNPFVGGLKTSLDGMGHALIVRERVSASFATETDVLGNVWSGIRADVFVEKFDEYRGLSYSHYYLTLPGVPILCHFTKLRNGIGIYRNFGICTEMFLSGKEGLADIYVSFANSEGMRYRGHFGAAFNQGFDRLAEISREGADPCAEKLYVYRDGKRSGSPSGGIGSDINQGHITTNASVTIANGETKCVRPYICLFSEKELTLEAVADFDRILF